MMVATFCWRLAWLVSRFWCRRAKNASISTITSDVVMPLLATLVGAAMGVAEALVVESQRATWFGAAVVGGVMGVAAVSGPW